MQTSRKQTKHVVLTQVAEILRHRYKLFGSFRRLYLQRQGPRIFVLYLRICDINSR